MNDRVSITMLEDGVADVRMTRAEKMNALDPKMFGALCDAIDELKAAKGLRAVVLSGEGKAFCAGLDLMALQKEGDAGVSSSGAELTDRDYGIANRPQYVAWGWRELEVPVIAAAHGVAFGGGFQIFSGADIRIATPDLRCAIMEMKWGLVPDMAGYPLWRGNVRGDVLRELTYTNREFSGEDAQRLGFVTHLAENPHARALELAQAIAGKHPQAVRGAKRIFNMMGHASDAELLMAESVEQKAVIRTPNQMEAVMAEMQKRKANFVD